MQDRLTRSSSDKVIAGVCGGLARYFNIDSTIIRLVFLLAVFLGGVSPLIYVVLWVVMPMDTSVLPTSTTPPQLPTQQDPTGEWRYDPYTGEQIRRDS